MLQSCDDWSSFCKLLLKFIHDSSWFFHFMLLFLELTVKTFILVLDLRQSSFISHSLSSFIIKLALQYIHFLLLKIAFPSKIVDSLFKVLALSFELLGIIFSFGQFSTIIAQFISILVVLVFHIPDLPIVHLHFSHGLSSLSFHFLLKLLDLLKSELWLSLCCHHFSVIFASLRNSLLQIVL